MKLFAVALFALFAVSAAEVNWDNIDWSKVLPVQDMPGFWDGRDIRPVHYPGDMTRTGRIVGGEIVTPHSHPYQCGLLIAFGGGTGLCGCSIISNRAILTAAHCPINSLSTQVRMGAHQLTAAEPTQVHLTIPPSGYRLHAGYNPSNLNNDIALLVHPPTFGFTPEIQPIALAGPESGTFAGELATVSGWGRTSDGSGATSAVLRSVQNNVITNAVCAATYGTNVVVASTICITTAGGRGTCNGDSGGPLTVGGAGGARLHIGTVSFGAAAGCEQGFPAGFARTSSFHAWIMGQWNT
jgi:secreted trypsin-like serine protease